MCCYTVAVVNNNRSYCHEKINCGSDFTLEKGKESNPPIFSEIVVLSVWKTCKFLSG